jgi:hypothetical protein
MVSSYLEINDFHIVSYFSRKSEFLLNIDLIQTEEKTDKTISSIEFIVTMKS